MLTVNSFFCGLHYIMWLADQAHKILRVWERSHSTRSDSEATTVPGGYQRAGEVGCVRTVYKALESHYNKQSSNHLQFKAYLQTKGVPIILLARFVGIRFNVLFLNAAGVYYFREQI